MLVDIVNPGWAPVYQSNLTEDVQGYIKAPDTALTYRWKHFIGGHMGRLGTRDDIALHQRYMADIADSSRKALDTVDPTPYFVKYGENTWAAVRGYLDAVTAAAAEPVIEKYTGVLAAADVFTASTDLPRHAVAATRQGLRLAGSPVSSEQRSKSRIGQRRGLRLAIRKSEPHKGDNDE